MRYDRSLAAGMLAVLLLTGCQSGGGSAVSGAASVSGEVGVSSSASVAVSAPASSQEAAAVSGVLEVTKTADELVALSERGEWAWFDDAVMIGDSVTLKLKNFVAKQRQTTPDYFGGGQFLASGSLGSANALWEVDDKSVHPAYQGEKMKLEESIPLTGAKKIYLMLGINDIVVYGLEGAVENYRTLLDNILAAVPDAQLFVQSATPICEGAEVGALNNANLEAYNQLLLAMCEEREIRFVDVASVMRDENGYLPRDYCSDPDGMGIHLQDMACQLWLGYLMEDARLMQEQ